MWLAACDLGSPARPRHEAMFAAPPPDFVSGTRLRARYHLVEGALQVFITFHDVVLDVDCAYEDESGAHVGPLATSYCFPAGMARHREGTGPFVDGACAVRGAFPPSTGAASYVIAEPRDACATAPLVFAALAPRSELTFFKDQAGACSRGQRVPVQRLGERLAPETFVRAVEQTEPRSGRMQARLLVGEDGSRRVVGGFDRDRGEASRVGTAEDGVRRWVPARTAFVGGGDLLFDDAACTVPVASKIGRTATCPLSAALVLEGNCGAGRYHALGDRVALPLHRDDACTNTPAPDVLAFRLGPAIAASSFAPALSFAIGTSRVRRRAIGEGGDRAVTWGELIDSETNEACEVLETAGGALRCLPAAAESVSFFADEACSRPAFARVETGCEVGAAPRFVRDALEAPPRAFVVGTELSVMYTRSGGRCSRFRPTVASRVFAAEEIATTTFPLATLVAD